jgi:hypothetical protein
VLATAKTYHQFSPDFADPRVLAIFETTKRGTKVANLQIKVDLKNNILKKTTYPVLRLYVKYGLSWIKNLVVTSFSMNAWQWYVY